VFAEQQLTNYIAWADQDIRGTLRRWQTRGHPYAHFDQVGDMPTARHTPPQQATDIDGYQVMLVWCRPGVIVFKTLDVDNEELNWLLVLGERPTARLADLAATAAATRRPRRRLHHWPSR
jgi:hypothetical protein